MFPLLSSQVEVLTLGIFKRGLLSKGITLIMTGVLMNREKTVDTKAATYEPGTEAWSRSFSTSHRGPALPRP